MPLKQWFGVFEYNFLASVFISLKIMLAGSQCRQFYAAFLRLWNEIKKENEPSPLCVIYSLSTKVLGLLRFFFFFCIICDLTKTFQK